MAATDTAFRYTPPSTHNRSASLDSMSSEKDFAKEALTTKSSTSSDRPSCDGDTEEREESAPLPNSSDVFEQQLTQLQEQLVSSMIENQNLCK